MVRCGRRLWVAEARRLHKRRVLLLRRHPSRRPPRLQIPSRSEGAPFSFFLEGRQKLCRIFIRLCAKICLAAYDHH